MASIATQVYNRGKARRMARERIERLCAIGRGVAIAVAIAPLVIGFVCGAWAVGHYYTFIKPLAGV